MPARDGVHALRDYRGQPDPLPRRAGAWIIGALLVALGTLPFVLIPEFPAGDAHSHVYNAWLRRRVEAGEFPGLKVVPLITNRLYGSAVDMLLRALDPARAETVAQIGVALLLLFSSFLYVRVTAGSVHFGTASLLSMVAFGWSFNMGFSDYVIAVALCSLAVALLADGMSRGAAGISLGGKTWWVLGLGLLAALANPLPVLWLGACAIYVASRRFGLTPGWSFAVSAAAIVGLSAAAALLFPAVWSASQFLNAFGVDQLYVYDHRYKFMAIAVSLLALLIVFVAWRQESLGVATDPLAFALLASLLALTFPGGIKPSSGEALWFIAPRSSSINGVAWIGFLGTLRWPRSVRAACAFIAVAYFGMLFDDWVHIAEVQRAISRAVRRAPADTRFIGSFTVKPPAGLYGTRVNQMSHAMDRACMGYCLDYGNYEPATCQFSLRCATDNDAVLCDPRRTAALEAGRYVARPSDSGLRTLRPCGGDARIEFCVATVELGSAVLPITVWPFLRH